MTSIRPSVELIRRCCQKLLPSDAVVTTWADELGEFIVEASWKLPADPSGRQRMSRPVRMVVLPEVLKDLDEASAEIRALAEQRFEEWLDRRLVQFKSAHARASGGTPDLWIVRRGHLK